MADPMACSRALEIAEELNTIALLEGLGDPRSDRAIAIFRALVKVRQQISWTHCEDLASHTVLTVTLGSNLGDALRELEQAEAGE